MVTLKADLQVGFELADRASHLALSLFRRGVASTLKVDGTPVTEADRNVERLLRDGIRDLRPDDSLLGEEFGGTGATRRTWIIDPIDGTEAFVKRDPDWRVQLALEIDGEVAIAVVVAPALGLCWWASQGNGAFEAVWPRREAPEPRRLAVSDTASVSDSRIEAYPVTSMALRLPGWNLQHPTSVVPIHVVRGEQEAFIFEGCFAWDHAPWILLVEEAGGRFTDWAGGQSPHQCGGLFSNAALHPALAMGLGLV